MFRGTEWGCEPPPFLDFMFIKDFYITAVQLRGQKRGFTSNFSVIFQTIIGSQIHGVKQNVVFADHTGNFHSERIATSIYIRTVVIVVLSESHLLDKQIFPDNRSIGAYVLQYDKLMVADLEGVAGCEVLQLHCRQPEAGADLFGLLIRALDLLIVDADVVFQIYLLSTTLLCSC